MSCLLFLSFSHVNLSSFSLHVSPSLCIPCVCVWCACVCVYGVVVCVCVWCVFVCVQRSCLCSMIFCCWVTRDRLCIWDLWMRQSGTQRQIDSHTHRHTHTHDLQRSSLSLSLFPSDTLSPWVFTFPPTRTQVITSCL